ncbi:MAG: phosphate/phosphite/phosphonate ABC transporter substrate-binding protein [Anaerolinea sp.]|nr:phosphate/phosphite/phosphonate ABC transporter substrate-binding protein [Anaerolinea sp.]
MRYWGYVLLIGLLFACTSAPPSSDAIRLSELHPLPVRLVSDVVPLRVSVAAVVSPQGTLESYQPLLDYLSHQLDRPVELVQRQTYAETNTLIEENAVDIAFVCTSAYIEGHDRFGMELLAAPQVNGSASYQSVLIVPASSSAHEMADLEGVVFAFTDPISFSGRVYPTYLVQQLGSTPEDFFARTFFTYNHDNAIRAVANGIADGAAVDSLVYDFAIQRDPALADQVRVIHRSPPFGIPPVVINPNARPQLKAVLQELLLNMSANAEGQAALAALGVEEFVVVNNDRYDSARAVIQAVETIAP